MAVDCFEELKGSVSAEMDRALEMGDARIRISSRLNPGSPRVESRCSHYTRLRCLGAVLHLRRHKAVPHPRPEETQVAGPYRQASYSRQLHRFEKGLDELAAHLAG